MRTLIVLGISLLSSVSYVHASDPIKIGMSQPLTGDIAAAGTYVANGARVAVEVVNKSGGVLGRQIQLILEDNKSNPKEAVATAEKLLSGDKVPVILGAWGSTLTLAIMPRLLEYKVPMVVETASSSKVTTSGNPWVFRISPPSAIEAKAFGDTLFTKFTPAIKKADMLVVNNDWGRGASDEFTKLMRSKGVQIGAVETMAPDATDLSAQLAKIKQSGGDTLFVTTGIEQLTLVLKQAQEQRVPQRIVSTGGSSAPDQLIEQAGLAANGSYHIVFFAPWFPEDAAHPEVAKTFIEAWKKKGYAAAGLTDGFRGYDGILTAVQAIKDAGKAEPAAIRDALWNVNVKGANGDIKFEKAGPAGQESGQSIPNIYVVQIKDGKVVKP
ncbi:ABC transporter substrate-binding protein [Bradyrhizobium sp. URHD0069]|uniref:ABC transporter substrate-binding protein n=1 Tax=Bradyrhizobium sp. URHD0069 TaxID=1380355 RepID=UPI000495D53C|nr:ABC transporter substrate-binding protein [Bradyrhizobium sp. URHD0069]